MEDTARLDARCWSSLAFERAGRAAGVGNRAKHHGFAAPAYAEASCPTNASVGILPLSFRVNTGSGHKEWRCQ